jgi:hypothetical protein
MKSDPRISLDVVMKKNIPTSAGNQTLVIQPLANHFTAQIEM